MTFVSLPRCVRAIAWATVAAIASVPAHADPLVYTSQSLFLSAVSNSGTDHFDDLSTAGATSSPVLRTAGVYGYRATASTSSFFAAGSGSDHWLSPNRATDTITFDAFTGGTIDGIGGFFLGTDINGNFEGTSTLTIVATDASGSTSVTLVDPGTKSFLGFLSTSAITSLTVVADGVVGLQTADPVWPTVNDLVLAGTPGVVPEPGAAALLGLGLVAVWLGRRRTRA